MSVCTFPDCGKVAVARTLCRGHYGQWQRGTPLRPIAGKTSPVLEDEKGWYVEIRDRNNRPKAKARISPEDRLRVGARRWSCGPRGYVYTRRKRADPPGPQLMGLHRFLLEPDPEHDVDHINKDVLDYRRENLREVTRSQNNENRVATARSGARNVYAHHNKFAVRLRKDGKDIYGGLFDTLEEADTQARRLRDVHFTAHTDGED